MRNFTKYIIYGCEKADRKKKVNPKTLENYIDEEIGYEFCSYETTAGFEIIAIRGNCKLTLDETGAITDHGCEETTE